MLTRKASTSSACHFQTNSSSPSPSTPSSNFNQLTPQQQQVISQLFSRIDLNKNGVIEKEELKRVMEVMLQQDPSLAEKLGMDTKAENALDLLFDQLDVNGDDVLSFREFAEPFAKMFLSQNGNVDEKETIHEEL
ncbi:hypothetical protein FDP41_002622 [Naegleria fowleri]|uniref:EF-hand domain-containing protein n=1 Tax=Naegleria fowleri TaxID=5763 RepID=A0A6A5BM47_NAEFO|nr:uncharacterized protein FDP41_002622 [Naegleria fowleri]KAF0978107.1 hypothetical protein FDP41_002622 [Naegleria fowleri]CAG4717505.1 unnamed protein product [Naegleria fowleri]